MTCCTYKCEQGRDCPVRKQSIEAINQAYIERGRVPDTYPYIETVGTVKALIAWLVLVAAVGIIFMAWVKV
ncbi:hypothetical protein UFOVP377_34 [uncultured Caudovirales phage]|uniref:Uncharacterized protein n=1 Tax=uncultured Caudovirales phage TaxID=2100421 RepID=A0A6J7X145_9CAUD|nr:hypothetical protein UFOVP377_34 [uncultured Caudovirales phage]